MLNRSSVPAMLFLGCVFSGCASNDYVELYKTEPRAPSYSEDQIEGLDTLGGKLVDQGANFSVYSENATRIDLLLFDDPEAERPTKQFEMTRFGDVWNLYVEGVGLGQHYGYVAWGPNWTYDPNWQPGRIEGFVADVDGAGNRFNPNKLLTDPYARALHRDHDWSKGSTASGPARTSSTWGAATKSVIAKSEYVWSANETQWRTNRKNPDWAGHRWTDAIVYEVHLKGFTKSPASGVDHPGTYLGLAEKAAYLKELGVTAVELLPVFEKPLDGGYWGYQTLNFFAPELSYGADKRPGKLADEFKYMVDVLHQHDIEVYLDVVYNHTGEGGLWREKIAQSSLDSGTSAQLKNFDPKEVAGLYSFRGLDNQAYYALSHDKQTYWNNSGVGNQTRANHTPMRRMIIDSLRYWADEMHVDGYRFDLAPVLGEKDNDHNNWDDPRNTVLQEIIDDEVLRTYNTRIIAEPWSLQHFVLGGFPSSATTPGVGWYEWNANFRDVWRDFLNSDDRGLSMPAGPIDIGGSLTGSYALFNHNGRRPYHSVNFITAHDGFTLYDLFAYNEKVNGCHPLNPTCCDGEPKFCDAYSGESHNRSRNWTDEAMKRQMMRNSFVAMLVAHGTPMILGGDEWIRTQLGNNNAYSDGADNDYNWHDWGSWQANDERHRMHSFVKELMAFRKSHLYAFTPDAYGMSAPFAWKDAGNGDLQGGEWNGRAMMVHYYDNGPENPQILIAVNMTGGDVTFTLPEGTEWHRRIDTQQYFDSAAYFSEQATGVRQSGNITLDGTEALNDATYVAKSRTFVVFEGF